MFQWFTTLNQASLEFGKPLFVATSHKEDIIKAGFVDVVDYVAKVPVGPWPKDPKAKEIGRYEMMHMSWSREEIETLNAGARADFKNPKIHLCSYFHFVYGRKPGGLRDAQPGQEEAAGTR